MNTMYNINTLHSIINFVNVWSYGILFHMTSVYARLYDLLPTGNKSYNLDIK